MTRLIGDVHGKYKQYSRIISECKSSIQVGDMGVGFRRVGSAFDGQPYANPPYDKMVAGDHRFIRGNHDNPNVCDAHTQYIPDGTIESGVMFIGGALSVDREYRTEGYDWWADEELSAVELHQMVDLYQLMKPHTMITHECPESVAEVMMALSGRRKLDFPSRTRQAFQSMFEIHQPARWCFGHWHMSFDGVIDGTRFVCLAELEWKDIDL